MASHDLWLVFALLFFLAAAFLGCFTAPPANVGRRLWGIHPGWLACGCVTCFFLIR